MFYCITSMKISPQDDFIFLICFLIELIIPLFNNLHVCSGIVLVSQNFVVNNNNKIIVIV